jgi:glycosyltransferase involved in cell wall biosynthesis
MLQAGKGMDLNLTVLMPVYNEEQNLIANVTQLIDKLDEFGIEFELLIVDDGSTDATPQLVDDLAASDRRVRAIHQPVHAGIGCALYTGFADARAEYTIFVPADLAMDLNEFSKYVEAAQKADIVVGLRSDRRDSLFSRKVISLLNIALLRLLFAMPVHQFQYICMYRTSLLQEIQLEYLHSAFIQAEVLIKARDMGCRLTEVTVGYIPRTGGVAKGANIKLVLQSGRDMLHFWVRWLFKKRSRDGRRDWRVGMHYAQAP